MSGVPLKDVPIMGGGTAGWTTAAYPVPASGETVRIARVESPAVPGIAVPMAAGVG